MIKEKKQKMPRWKMILLIILSLILVITITILILVKVFVVKNVKVEGNVLYDEELIKSTVFDDEWSWNSLYVVLKYTFTEPKKAPFIDTIEIQMEDPQTLKIKVYEKGMMGYLPVVGENAYFDKDGFVVETSTRVIEGVPKIEGLDCAEVVLLEKLPIEDQLLKQLLTLTQALKKNGLAVDTIRYGVEGEPVLIFDSIAVNMGSLENLTQKMECVKGILPKTEGMSGTLHLENWVDESSNIVFEKDE